MQSEPQSDQRFAEFKEVNDILDELPLIEDLPNQEDISEMTKGEYHEDSSLKTHPKNKDPDEKVGQQVVDEFLRNSEV